MLLKNMACIPSDFYSNNVRKLSCFIVLIHFISQGGRILKR